MELRAYAKLVCEARVVNELNLFINSNPLVARDPYASLRELDH